MTDSQRIEYCKNCKKKNKQLNKPPPCADCDYKAPELMDENTEAWELWSHVQTQWRAGLALIGLDYDQVETWADRLDIDLSLGMWAKIRVIERHIIKHQTTGNKGNDNGHTQGGEPPQKTIGSR